MRYLSFKPSRLDLVDDAGRLLAEVKWVDETTMKGVVVETGLVANVVFFNHKGEEVVTISADDVGFSGDWRSLHIGGDVMFEECSFEVDSSDKDEAAAWAILDDPIREAKLNAERPQGAIERQPIPSHWADW